MEQAFNDLSPPSPGKMMPLEEEHDDQSSESLSGSPKKSKKKRDSSALRKAPQAPKRFKSSYICFFMAKQPDIKGELGNKATVTEISKRSAEMWRNLPTDERAHWDDVAAKDKQRYMVEKASYTGPWQVPWKRAKKDPSAPKRPMSAFLYFSQGRRKKLKDKNPNLKNTEVSRLLGELWRNATEEEKRPHIDQEKKEREKYKVAIAEWRKEYEKKKEDQRKQQAEQATQWAQQYSPEGGEAPTPQIQQYSQPAYMPPPPGYTPYPPPHYYSPYPPPPAYQYPTNGKQPVILGPNGMPHYQHMGPPQQTSSGYPPQGPPPHYEENQAPGPATPPNYDYAPEQISPEPQTAE